MNIDDDSALLALLTDGDAVPPPQAETLALLEDLEVHTDADWSTLLLVDHPPFVGGDSEGPAHVDAPAAGAPPLSSTTPKTETEAQSSTRAPRRDSRQRQRQEIAYLRQRAAALEAELDRLQATSSSSPSSLVSSSASSSPVSDDIVEPMPKTTAVVDRDEQHSSVEAFWARMARTELAARQLALAENMRLRELLAGQLRLARSLERLLRKRPMTLTEWQDDGASTTGKRMHYLEPTSDAEIDEELIAGFDRRFPEVDRIMAECGLAQRTTGHQDARFNPGTANGRGDNGTGSDWCLEFLDCKVVPFAPKITREASWAALATPRIQLATGSYEVVEATDDLIKAVFTVRLRLRNTDAIGRARFAVRRYETEGRLVLVWGLCSTTEGGALRKQVLRMKEEGWSVIEPHPERPELSMTRFCGRMRPNMVIPRGSRTEDCIGLLSEAVLQTYHRTLQGMYDLTAKMLLELAQRDVDDA